MHRSAAELTKPVSRLGIQGAPSPLNGAKRKAEDDASKVPDKVIKPNSSLGLPSHVSRRQAAPPLNMPKHPHEKNASTAASKPAGEKAASAPRPTSLPPPNSSPLPSPSQPKPPAKGSYADIMARAKLAQEQRGQNQVGVIKHQATNKEKVSKLAERRREEDERARAAKQKSTARPGSSGKLEKTRSVSPTKKGHQPRIPKAPRPPLHAPSSPYKGTMRSGSRRARAEKKHSRYDEYLGTDEEDNSDVIYDDDNDDEGRYASDASSVMEAGAFELDEEERSALKAAKEEDARELARESQLKREKEERRRRLMNLANKRR